jgi:hypothetical protein
MDVISTVDAAERFKGFATACSVAGSKAWMAGTGEGGRQVEER